MTATLPGMITADLTIEGDVKTVQIVAPVTAPASAPPAPVVASISTIVPAQAQISEEGGHWYVRSADGTRTMGGPYANEGEALERLRQMNAAKTDRRMGVVRLDVGELRTPTRLPNGFVRADAYLTRSGVFPYRNADGSVRREWRPPDEVFKADSLATLQLAPLTNDHPPKLLTSATAKEFTCGSVGESIRRDGHLVAASIMVTDADLISRLDAGEARQVSAGYLCDMDDTAGITPEGERFDSVQRNIRYNHVAVLPRGRAGADVRVRMDAADLAVILDQETAPSGAPPSQRNTVHKIRIDGVDFEVSSAPTAQAFEKFSASVQAKLDAAAASATEATKKADQLQAKLDSATAEVDKLKKDAADAPAKIKAELASRAALETKARKVLGDKAKLDGFDTRGVQIAVLAKLAPAAKFDGKSADYVEARFDSELERFDADDADANAGTTNGKRTDAAEECDDDEEKMDGERLDADDAREKMIKAGRNAWKKPVGARLSDDFQVQIQK